MINVKSLGNALQMLVDIRSLLFFYYFRGTLESWKECVALLE